MWVRDRWEVHLCMVDDRDGSCALYHVDVGGRLFGSAVPADPDDAAEYMLHEALSSFPDAHFPHVDDGVLELHLLDQNDKLLSSLVYHAGAVCPGPTPHAREGYSATAEPAPADDGLIYVLRHPPVAGPPRRITAPRYYVEEPDPVRDDSFWRAIPHPPYYADDDFDASRVTARAVVAGAMWASMEGGGTYSFHAGRRAWTRIADWELPFHGNAAYVEACELWFGISSGGDLCAADLAVATPSCPPEVYGAWEDFRPPRGWCNDNMTDSYLVHIGGGYLCTVRFFAGEPGDRWRSRGPVAVLSAVCVLGRRSRDEGEDGFDVQHHLSMCINLPAHYTGLKWAI